jgi:hypothetical protein
VDIEVAADADCGGRRSDALQSSSSAEALVATTTVGTETRP